MLRNARGAFSSRGGRFRRVVGASTAAAGDSHQCDRRLESRRMKSPAGRPCHFKHCQGGMNKTKSLSEAPAANRKVCLTGSNYDATLPGSRAVTSGRHECGKYPVDRSAVCFNCKLRSKQWAKSSCELANCEDQLQAYAQGRHFPQIVYLTQLLADKNLILPPIVGLNRRPMLPVRPIGGRRE